MSTPSEFSPPSRSSGELEHPVDGVFDPLPRLIEAIEESNLSKVQNYLNIYPELKVPAATIQKLYDKLLDKVAADEPINYEIVISPLLERADGPIDKTEGRALMSKTIFNYGLTRQDSDFKTYSNRINTLNQTFRVDVPYDEVQEKYRHIVFNIDFYRKFLTFSDLFFHLKEMTQIDPQREILIEVMETGNMAWTREVAESLNIPFTHELEYQTFKYAQKAGVRITKRWLEAHDYIPPQNDLNEVYIQLLEEAVPGQGKWLQEMKELIAFTNQQPVFDSGKLQQLYVQYLEMRKYTQIDDDSLLGLIEVMDVKLDAELGYQHLLKVSAELLSKPFLVISDDGVNLNLIEHQLVAMEAATGVTFQFLPEDAQHLYRLAIEHSNARGLLNLYELSGIAPKVDQATAQKYLRSLLVAQSGKFFHRLEEVLGYKLELNLPEIHATYYALMERENFIEIWRLFENSNVEPDLTILTNKIKLFLKRHLPHNFSVMNGIIDLFSHLPYVAIGNLIREFALPIDEKDVIDIFENLATQENFNEQALASMCKLMSLEQTPSLVTHIFRSALQTWQKYPRGRAQNVVGLVAISQALNIQPNLRDSELIEWIYWILAETARGAIIDSDYFYNLASLFPKDQTFTDDQLTHLSQLIIQNQKPELLDFIQKRLGIEVYGDEFEYLVAVEAEELLSQLVDTTYQEFVTTYSPKIEELMAEFSFRWDENFVYELSLRVLLNFENFSNKKLYLLGEVVGYELDFDDEILSQIAISYLRQWAPISRVTYLYQLGDIILPEPELSDFYDWHINQLAELQDDGLIFLSQLSELISQSGFGLTPGQLTRIRDHLLNSKAYNPEKGLIYHVFKNMTEYFGYEFTDLKIEMVEELIKQGDLHSIWMLQRSGYLKLEELPQTVVDFMFEYLIHAGEFMDLRELKITFGLEAVPLVEEKIQALYLWVLNWEEHQKLYPKSVRISWEQYLADLYDVTGVKPNFSLAERSLLLKRTALDNSSEVDNVLKVLGQPTDQDLKWLLEYYLLADKWKAGTKSNIDAFWQYFSSLDQEYLNQLFDVVLLGELYLPELPSQHLLPVTEIMSFITTKSFFKSLTQQEPVLPKEKILAHIERMLLSPIHKRYVRVTVEKLTEWMNETNITCPPETKRKLLLLLSQTDLDNFTRNENIWALIEPNLDLIDEQLVQEMYAYIVINLDGIDFLNNAQYLLAKTGVAPNWELMLSVKSEMLPPRKLKNLKEIFTRKVLNLISNGLSEQVENSLNLFGNAFKLDYQQIQELYIEYLFGTFPNPNAFELLLKHTPIDPQQEILAEFLVTYCEEAGAVSARLGTNQSNFTYLASVSPIAFKTLIENFQLQTVTSFENFAQQNKSLIRYLRDHRDEEFLLTTADIASTQDFFSDDMVTLQIARQHGFGITTLNEEQAAKLYQIIIQDHPEWVDSQISIPAADKFAQNFGYLRFFEFINQPDWTFHDLLLMTDKILELQNTSQLKSNQFFINIIRQVLRDSGSYSDESALRYFYSLINSLNPDFDQTLEKAKNYGEIPELAELATYFEDVKVIFSSWNNLKKYAKLDQLVQDNAILIELKQLSNSGQQALYEYVAKLAFHPQSRVNWTAVRQFWQDPEAFFQREASFSDESVVHSLQPINYTQVDHLDLSPEQLRDAIVTGTLDKIQRFKPLSVEYELPFYKGIYFMTLDQAALAAVGGIQDSQPGLAKQPERVQAELMAVLATFDITWEEFIEGYKHLPEEAHESAQQILFDSQIGIPVTWRKAFTQTHRKSDAKGILAGTDTINCMPYEDGKAINYHVNPNIGQMTVQMAGNEFDRTIAQSVLTEDLSIKSTAAEIYSQFSYGSQSVAMLIPEVLEAKSSILACDNIEVAPNWQEKADLVIRWLYEDFLRVYLQTFGSDQGFDMKRALVGLGFTDIKLPFPKTDNKTIPTSPVMYSDKFGQAGSAYEQVQEIDLTINEQPTFKRRVEVREQKAPEYLAPAVTGVTLLHSREVLQVAAIQGMAYHDNQVQVEPYYQLQNMLIGVEINNAHKDRPHLHLAYYDPDGAMRGYFIAFEGVLAKHPSHDPDEMDAADREKVIYVHELASDRESTVAGGRLVKGFLELYKKNYLDKGLLVPLYTESREKTTYHVILKKLNKVGAELGVQFELEEVDQNNVAGDIMHHLLIRPVKI